MEFCEMLKSNVAYVKTLDKGLAEQMTKIRGEKYNKGDKIILCEVGHDCLHGGRSIYDTTRKQNTVQIMFICELVKKVNELETKAVVNN